jgi:hypothetical protein
MKYRNVLLALSLCSIMFIPSVQAQSNNDFAPSQSPEVNQPPIVPPPGSEPSQQMSSGGGHGRHGGPRHGGPRHGGGGRGNGELRAKVMQRFDADGDGVLSDGERAQVQAAREQMGRGRGGRQGGVRNFGDPNGGGNNFRGGPGGGGRHHGRHGGGGDGDDASKQERKMKMMKRFDANGDGTLDPSEQAKLDAAKAERHRQRESMRGQDDQPMLHDPATNRQP